jgi:hypothetical protein
MGTAYQKEQEDSMRHSKDDDGTRILWEKEQCAL